LINRLGLIWGEGEGEGEGGRRDLLDLIRLSREAEPGRSKDLQANPELLTAYFQVFEAAAAEAHFSPPHL
jgi:hypothetical protein